MFALGLLLVAIFALPSVASAHERRTIANGKYDVVVGWDSEPPYLGQRNAASIRIAQAGSDPAVPIQGVDKTLKVQIKQGASTKVFPLQAVFGQLGYYVADILPTRDGDYQFTFVGSIGDDQVNENFDSADGKFDAVQSASSLEFPLTAPDPVQISAAVSAAQADAQSTRTLALAGIGVGVLGVLLGAAGWLTRPRSAAPVRDLSTEGR